jgi:hypothetical protein
VSKRKRKSLGRAMGAAIVGFDYQVFRSTKPPPELVEQGKPIAPVPAADGGRISIGLPEDLATGDDGASVEEPADPDEDAEEATPSSPPPRG